MAIGQLQGPRTYTLGHCGSWLITPHLKSRWALHHMSRHLEKNGKDHWKALKGIGRYVKGSADTGLIFDGSSGAVVLHAYIDAALA